MTRLKFLTLALAVLASLAGGGWYAWRKFCEAWEWR